jgi:hypothetical protein
MPPVVPVMTALAVYLRVRTAARSGGLRAGPKDPDASAAPRRKNPSLRWTGVLPHGAAGRVDLIWNDPVKLAESPPFT